MSSWKNPSRMAAAFFSCCCLGAARPAAAQDMPRVQVFGGYSYTRFDSPSFGFANASGLNGYNFAPAYNLIRGFGVMAELSGQYGSKLNLRDIAVGPQFLYPRGKETVLRPSSHRRSPLAGASWMPAKKTRHGRWSLGGGMDYDLTPRFAVRVFQVDYLHTTLFSETQNNLRFSTGLVYRWGTIKKKHTGTLAPSP